MKTLMIIIALLGVIFIAYSQDEIEDIDPIDKELKECLSLDSNSNTINMIKCTEKAAEKWDKELNKYYQLLLKNMNMEDQRKLRSAQRAWLTYRKKELEYSEYMYLNLKQGTMWRVVAASRRLELLKTRASELKEYYRQLKDL